METANEVPQEVIEEDEETAAPKVPELWNYKALFATVVIMFIIQEMFLNCMCDEGSIKVEFAMMFDLLVVIRTAFAVIFKEKGNTWKVYMWLPFSGTTA